MTRLTAYPWSDPTCTEPDWACVYVLARLDRVSFKLGWARSPIARAHQLPEYARGDLDLDASRAIWLPTRPRAEQIERSMHKTLAPYRVKVAHPVRGRHAGASEWFAGHAQESALRLLGQMPLQPRSRVTARVVPLSLTVPEDGAGGNTAGPQETWWRIEDLLERLARNCHIQVEGLQQRSEVVRVTVYNLRVLELPDTVELRRAALDAETYQCWRAGKPLAYVETLAWQGHHLVLCFAPRAVIERWDDGADLAWQMRGFLGRLERQMLAPRT